MASESFAEQEHQEIFDDFEEEQKERAVYYFEHIKFSPSGRRGVASLPVQMLCFLCQIYVPGFAETSYFRQTKRELLELLHRRVSRLCGTFAS